VSDNYLIYGYKVLRRSHSFYPLNNDTDADGDPLTITAVSGSLCQIYNSNYLSCNFPYSGIFSFTYTISDGQGGTATGSASVEIMDNGGGGIGFP
jgi:hypothetical protein